MKFRLGWVCQGIMLVLLSSCASLMGPQTREIPLARLQDAISQRFPFNNRFLQLLDIRVTNPRVSLQPQGNRLLTSMDIAIAPPLINRSWTGNLAISGRPQVDMARYAVVLADPRVEGMNINGLDPAYASQVTRIGSFLAEQLLMDMPLYTFRPEDLRFAGTSFNPTAIAMRQDAVVITFEPVK
jgi:hypothetical protein